MNKNEENMLKKILFLLLLITSFANAQNVNIPDANFKAKLLEASSTNQIAKNLLGNYFKIDVNNDTEIQVSEAEQVSYLNFNNINISSDTIFILSLTGIEAFVNIEELHCYKNELISINLQGLNNLKYLEFGENNLTSLDLQGLNNLETLHCDYNNMNSLNISGLANLKYLWCRNSWLYNLAIQNCPNLKIVLCSGNFISSLNLENNVNLNILKCEDNHLSSLNLNGCSSLQTLHCFNNQLVYLDLNTCKSLIEIRCNHNQLNTLLIKNGRHETLEFQYNPNLEFICCDNSQIEWIENKIIQYWYNCHVNTYCSFTPGGDFNTIYGQNRIDINNNGCDTNDNIYSYLKYVVTNGTVTDIVFSNEIGEYNIYVQNGPTIYPQLENPSYYNISPNNLQVSFPSTTSSFNQNFCIAPNGVHHDVEVSLIPTTPARPGFNATYKIVYKNKGNQIENGTVTFGFENQDVLDFVSCTPAFDLQNFVGNYNVSHWNYTNLLPLETREITVTLNLNSPTETPPVNIGDILSMLSTITPLDTDEFVIDNSSPLRQIVVGSYDPNDKTCVEGQIVSSEIIGQYVHYVIRFENTGTYPAENIVVKDIIDTTKFDISTLIPIHSSHNFETRISDTNKVEFIFEGINLPFDDANNDGYIAFKIKTKPTLVVGDTFSNSASIYFDYNFPIVTNTSSTTIQALSNPNFDKDNSISIYPNPTNSIVNINSNNTIKSVQLYDFHGRLLQTKLINETTSSIDISDKSNGIYFLKITSDKGSKVEKVIKE